MSDAGRVLCLWTSLYIREDQRAVWRLPSLSVASAARQYRINIREGQSHSHANGLIMSKILMRLIMMINSSG